MRRFYSNLLLLSLLLCCHSSFSQANIPAYVPADGLVGWWPLNGNAIDSSGTGNNGTASNVVSTSDRFGIQGAAFLFNGNSSTINIPDAASLRVRKITMSAWVRSNTSILKTIIFKSALNGSGEQYALNSTFIAVKVNSNCQPGQGWKASFFKQNLVAGDWVHVVGVFDGASLSVYKNGTLDSTIQSPGLIDSCIGGGLRFGLNNSINPDYFNGVIDDVGIWNRALTSAEILALYNAATDVAGYIGVNTAEPKRNLHVNDILRLEPRFIAPANPGKGDMYFDANLNKLRVFDGTVWQNCW